MNDDRPTQCDWDMLADLNGGKAVTLDHLSKLWIGIDTLIALETKAERRNQFSHVIQ